VAVEVENIEEVWQHLIKEFNTEVMVRCPNQSHFWQGSMNVSSLFF
jgi:uncharacterized Zn finger protein